MPMCHVVFTRVSVLSDRTYVLLHDRPIFGHAQLFQAWQLRAHAHGQGSQLVSVQAPARKPPRNDDGEHVAVAKAAISHIA